MFADACPKCSLQLRSCASCHGVAGPFDQFCGFCGHELALGPRRSAAWRLWLLVALIPIVAGLAFGLSPWSAPAVSTVSHLVNPGGPPPSAGPLMEVRSQELRFTGSIPQGWTAFDYSRAADPATVEPFVVVTRIDADNRPAARTRANLAGMSPQAAVVEMGRPVLNEPGIDPRSPLGVLSYEVGVMVGNPAVGDTVTVVRPAGTSSVAGRPAADAILKIVRGGAVFYFSRAYVLTPTGLFRVDAMVPGPDWERGDDARVAVMVRTLTFS